MPLKALLALACAVMAAPATAQPSPSMLAAAGPAIVRIVASDCGTGEPRGGSGFAWGPSGRIVTALHVVAGCRTIAVGYQGVGERNATVDRLLLTADLALLSVNQAPALTPLASSVRVPIGETVYVFGYGLGIATREEKPLYVTSANAQTPLLSDAVNGEALGQLRSLGSPALSTEVLRVDGNLLPGHSGAAVLDAAGRVVGIGSGGLQRGTVGTGWAIRARYLADLAAAPPLQGGIAPALATVANSPGYATVTPGAGNTAVRCGDLSFVRTRQRIPLGTLVASSDDQLGFSQIAQMTGRPWERLATAQFDIWTETTEGAGVALPAGATLRPSSGNCIATSNDGVVSLAVGSAALPDPGDAFWTQEVDRTTLAFAQSWLREFLPFMRQDFRFSYGPPRRGPGGLLVNRMTFEGQRPNMPPHAAFQTLLARGRTMVGIAAITRRAFLTDGPDFESWVVSVFAAHLSTVPR